MVKAAFIILMSGYFTTSYIIKEKKENYKTLSLVRAV